MMEICLRATILKMMVISKEAKSFHIRGNPLAVERMPSTQFTTLPPTQMVLPRLPMRRGRMTDLNRSHSHRRQFEGAQLLRGLAVRKALTRLEVRRGRLYAAREIG